MTGFLNPYGFVSIPNRDRLPAELADGLPPWHYHYDTKRWSGSIPITISTRTPLLLPDHAQAATTAGHNGGSPALPVRVVADGRPVLAMSAVKGMLRSAYEAVTNSRFGVFTGHDTQLAIRGEATGDVAARLKPGIVIARDEEARTATIQWVPGLMYTRDVPEMANGDRHKKPQAAVWAPTIGLGDIADCDRVEAWIRLMKHNRRGFLLWRAVVTSRPGELPAEAPPTKSTRSMTVYDYPAVRISGVLHRTGSRFPADPDKDKKHDERLVVLKIFGNDARIPGGLTQAVIECDMIAAWQAVIDSFKSAHDGESASDRVAKYGTYVHAPEKWRSLPVGRTMHVEVDAHNRPVALFPAMIGRKPFPGAPQASLPKGHRPATSIGELSPADRVFGWVRAGADEDGNAYRGHLRVRPGSGPSPGASSVRGLAEPLSLVTLNSPKPSQFLFYLGDENGDPLDGEEKKPENGYPAADGRRQLRGRKVFLTHAEVLHDMDGAGPYWAPPKDANTSPPKPVRLGDRQRFREYVAPAGSGAQVTTSVSNWVKPGTTFSVQLQVDNLSTVELGALVWLLTLPDGAMHKLGLGKPLGFGAVRVDIDWPGIRLYTGDALRDRYRSPVLTPEPATRDSVVQTRAAYLGLASPDLKQIRKEFVAAARGFQGWPVHYPRATPQSSQSPPAPQTESYKWWVANDQVNARRRHALPALDPDQPPVLPYLDEVVIESRRNGPPSRR